MTAKSQDPMALSGRSVLLGFQHALASVGGIITAPLIIALGMGLSESETAYVIASALVISGIATLIQIVRVGPVGSGLLAIQGTSFAFVGAIIYAFHELTKSLPRDEALGRLFGSMVVCAAIMIGLSWFVRSLKRLITPNVTGVTLLMIGVSLVWATGSSIWEGYQSQNLDQIDVALAVVVMATIGVLMVVPSIALRSTSVVLGLITGCVLAGVLGRLALPSAAIETRVFLPDFLPYGISIDPVIVLLLMPIFIISAAESIGDLTATNRLSGYQHGDDVYWLRIRGGLLGDSLNSGLAALVATFPNTTFSQNNGVIRATGATNPVIGIYAALILLGLGLLPITTDWIQAIPEPVVQGMTLILFSLVVLAGWSVIHSSAPAWQDYLGIAIAASLGGWVSLTVGDWSIMPAALVSIFSFPVTNATLLMLFIEIARGKLRS